MKRILLMVFRNLFFVPYGWFKLCWYASHAERYSEEQEIITYGSKKTWKTMQKAPHSLSNEESNDVTCSITAAVFL